MLPERDQVVGLPRDFLAAWLLLILRQWSMHGYALMQQLTTLGFAALDPATVYRTLRQLEKDGLIQSQWDLGSSGPARRTYRLTDAGDAFLATWAQGLEQFRQMLDSFFSFYGLVLPVQSPAEPQSRSVPVPPASSARKEQPPTVAYEPVPVSTDAVALAESVAAAYDAAVVTSDPTPAIVVIEEKAIAADVTTPAADANIAPDGAAVAAEHSRPAAKKTDPANGEAAPRYKAAVAPPTKGPTAKRAATRSSSRKLPQKGKKE